MKFKEINTDEFSFSPFKVIGKDWMLITAQKDNKVNTMTASWGGLGVMWGKNVAYIAIRPQRYTKEFVDYASNLSLSFFDNNFKKQLSYLGSVSGRNEDKISKSELTLNYEDAAPYFEEANKVLICKKLFAQEFKPESFIEQDIRSKFYPEYDYHTLYIAEITKVLIKLT